MNRAATGRRAAVGVTLATAIALTIAFAASAQASVCTITGTPGPDRLKGTNGDDVICALGGNDRINGRGGNDALYGYGGDDELIGGPGIDHLDGGAGSGDKANYAPDATQPVNVDLSTNTVSNDGQGNSEYVSGVEIVQGAKSQPNTLTGDDTGNRLFGGSAADTLSGGAGADLMRGFNGDDTLSGNGGADHIFPGLGTNTIDGGVGSDTLDYSGSGLTIGIQLIDSDGNGPASGFGGDPNDSFTAIENATGTAFDDNISILWTGVASLVSGRGGADALNTTDGDALDTLDGGGGGGACLHDAGDTTIQC